MKHLLRSVLASLFLLAAGTAFAAVPLDAKVTAFLASYEKVRAALADDNLDAAQVAAKALEGDAAATLVKAESIGEARKAFQQLSGKAVAFAKGQPGFFLAHCPMYPGGGDWVQISAGIANPYFGKSMLRCGEIVEQKQ
jgi:hypothetical protein